MDEYIQLKWNAHSSTFLENLSSLRDQQIYTDVTLSCGNLFYPAHRLVLSTCSSFFARALEVINCRSPVLLLHGIEQFILEHLLMFMYDGQVTIGQRDLPCFLQAARWLGVKGLDMGGNNPESMMMTEKHSSHSGVSSGQFDSIRYFQMWTQLLSPLVHSSSGPPSLEDLTSALHRVVGHLESAEKEEENAFGNMVVSNVTSLSTQSESELAMDSEEVIEHCFEPETVIKCENPDSDTEEEENVTVFSNSPAGPLGVENSFLDSSDSSDCDNNFEGWEKAEMSVPNNLKTLQQQLSQNNIYNTRSMSPDHSTEESCGIDVQNKRKKLLRCKHCNNRYNVRQELVEHLRTHGHNFCYLCSKGFISSKRYLLHMKLHEECSLHCCNNCDFVTQSKRGLSIHHAAMHGETSLAEEKRQGNRLVGQQEFLEDQTSISLLTCSICGFRSTHERGFKRHVTCKHSRKRLKDSRTPKDDDVRVMESEIPSSLYSCSVCDFSSPHRGGLKRHMTCKHLKHNLDDAWTSPEKVRIIQEREVIQGEKQVIQEERQVIQGERQVIQGEKQVTQEEKQGVQEEKQGVQEEKQGVQEERQVIQEEKRVIQEEKQVIQEEYHPPVSRFSCKICQFTSIHKRGFKKHMSCMHDISESQSDENVGKYSDMDEDDSSKIVLRSDKKNFECPHCNRIFDSSRLFQKHQVLGCGRYRCRFCRMRYRECERKEYLAHLQVHHKEAESMFKCNYCPYITDRRRSLSDHISKHTGSYRFTCPWCPFKCVRNNILQAHLHNYHITKMNNQEVEDQMLCNNEEGILENNSPQLSLENSEVNVNYDDSERNEINQEHLDI